MFLTTFFGYKCPKCETTIDIGVGEPKCPNCGTEMVPNGKAKSSAANVTCTACNTFYGLTNSDTCPKCGQPFS
jgi:rRNA maturation endonuclease Nob1